MTFVSTTEQQQWVTKEKVVPAAKASSPKIIKINKSQTEQTIEGFGTCFNELGWTSLRLLKEEDQDKIFTELFKPGVGANFTICRMPVGANDFSRNWYSYDETDDDYELKHFSIDNDKETLIPFIKTALKYNQALKIWASPWCPPTWMKKNHHYACQTSGYMFPEPYKNDLPKEKEIPEGEDGFLVDDKHLKTYSEYFGKFIDSYRAEGISNIFAVMPQNEFNSNQVFPSCVWKIESLNKFVGEYLGPEMSKRNIDVYFGTMERPFERFIDLVMKDEKSSKYVKCVGFQWAGKKAIRGIHRRYPELKLWQTEQECGDGKNNFDGAVYSWNLMCHYLNCGCTSYMYWNTSLIEGGISRWGWAQNSLVVVDEKTHTYRYSYEYYVLKHLSHFVQNGAKKIKIARTIEDDDVDVKILAFLNPNGEVCLICGNESTCEEQISFEIDSKYYDVKLPPLSFNSIVI